MFLVLTSWRLSQSPYIKQGLLLFKAQKEMSKHLKEGKQPFYD